MGELMRDGRNIAASVALCAGMVACGTGEQPPIPPNTLGPTLSTETAAPDFTRDSRPPLACDAFKPTEWSPIKDLYGDERRAATIGVDVILGVSKDQVFNGNFGEAKCGQILGDKDLERPVTVSGKGDLCMVVSVAGARQPDGTSIRSSEYIQAICAAPASPETVPTATSFPKSQKPKISCQPFELDTNWPAIPPKDVQELSERLGVSQDRARNGRFGNVICLQQLDPAVDRLRPINAMGFSQDCVAINIIREPSPNPDTFRQAVVAACAAAE